MIKTLTLIQKQKKLEYKFNKVISHILFFAKEKIIKDDEILFEIESLRRRISIINNTEPDFFIKKSKKELWDNRKYIRNRDINSILNIIKNNLNKNNLNKKNISLLSMLKNIISYNISENHKTIIWNKANLLIDILILWILADQGDEKTFNQISEKKKIFDKI